MQQAFIWSGAAPRACPWPDRLPQLPTASGTLKDLLICNTQWWAHNRDAVLDRWNDFLLG